MFSDEEMAAAELEVQLAEAFGHQPPAWALERVGPAAGSADEEDPGDWLEIRLAESLGDLFPAAVREVAARHPGADLVEAARLDRSITEAFGVAMNPDTAEVLAAAAASGKRSVSIEESSSPVETRLRLVESGTVSPAGEAIFDACLISAGEGSSAHYSAEVLALAVREGVFHAGLHSYVDHPTVAENDERPERSVNDLAGALTGDAVFRDGAVWSQIRVFSSHRDFIAERAGVIGLSIRGVAESEESRGGKPVVSRIVKALSVDLVTAAGRGGYLHGVVA